MESIRKALFSNDDWNIKLWGTTSFTVLPAQWQRQGKPSKIPNYCLLKQITSEQDIAFQNSILWPHIYLLNSSQKVSLPLLLTAFGFSSQVPLIFHPIRLLSLLFWYPKTGINSKPQTDFSLPDRIWSFTNAASI